MNELQAINNIENMIYEIRGKQVMLDSHLAILYQCSNGTKSINLAVKRHITRFPERFMFQLTQEEYSNICSRFQFETLNNSDNRRGTNLKYLPYVFTEQGVAMLATVLRTKIAESVSIEIMDAFVAMRKYISTNLIEQKYINNQVMKNTEDIKNLQESFSKFEEKKIINEIYFNGQIYDAYSKIVDILKEAKEELIIIDAYADKATLDIIREIQVNVTLIINERSKITRLDIEKYNEQYDNLTIIYNNTYHDRYFILDNKIIYHCGTSINNAGSKTFSINKIEDSSVASLIINNINKNINLAK